jgi:hypothetical protein
VGWFVLERKSKRYDRQGHPSHAWYEPWSTWRCGRRLRNVPPAMTGCIGRARWSHRGGQEGEAKFSSHQNGVFFLVFLVGRDERYKFYKLVVHTLRIAGS